MILIKNNHIKESPKILIKDDKPDYYNQLLETQIKMFGAVKILALEYYDCLSVAHDDPKIISTMEMTVFGELKRLFLEFRKQTVSILENWISMIKKKINEITNEGCFKRFSELYSNDENQNLDAVHFHVDDTYSYDNTYRYFSNEFDLETIIGSRVVKDLFSKDKVIDTKEVRFETVYGKSKEEFIEDLKLDQITVDVTAGIVNRFHERITYMETSLTLLSAKINSVLDTINAEVDSYTTAEAQVDPISRIMIERFTMLTSVLTQGISCYLQSVIASVDVYSFLIRNCVKMMELRRIEIETKE